MAIYIEYAYSMIFGMHLDCIQNQYSYPSDLLSSSNRESKITFVSTD
jgi:hypothetical protein